VNASGRSPILIPKPFALVLPIEGILPDDEDGPKRLIDIGRAGPVDCRELGRRGRSIDIPRRACEGDIMPMFGEERGEATMTN